MPRSERPELVVRDYEFLRTIGKGSYGEVWLCKQARDSKQYVVKKIGITQSGMEERKAALLECKLLSELRHPNIVPYKESFVHCGFLYIAMGYCEGGDLYTRLRLQSGRLLTERRLVEWFIQIAIALQHMHTKNILHRDLKTQNIFLTRTDIIKVGDLGIARVLESANSMATTMIGTPYYMSPELFANKPYNHKSDIWALGCVLYEMSTLKHAFNAKNFNALSYKILSGRIPDMPKHYSPELLDIMRAMLHQKPEKRPSARRVLSNPFIRKHIVLFLESTKDRCSSLEQPETEVTEQSDCFSTEPLATPKDSEKTVNVYNGLDDPPLQFKKSATNVKNSVKLPVDQPVTVKFPSQEEARSINEPVQTALKLVNPVSKVDQCSKHNRSASLTCSISQNEPKSALHSSPTDGNQMILVGSSDLEPTTDELTVADKPVHFDVSSTSDLSIQDLQITKKNEGRWGQMDARQRRRERRRLSENAGQRTEEREGSDIVHRIVLRQRNRTTENDDRTSCASRTEIETISRPASHPFYTSVSSGSFSPSSNSFSAASASTASHSSGSITRCISRDSSAHRYGQLFISRPVTCTSDPLPRTRPVINRSPDLGYVSVTASPSPSLVDRLDKQMSSISSLPLGTPSSVQRDGSNDSGMSSTESSSSGPGVLNKCFISNGVVPAVVCIPPPIREEDKEMAHLTTYMAETLGLGDAVNDGVYPSSSAQTTQLKSPLGMDPCSFPGKPPSELDTVITPHESNDNNSLKRLDQCGMSKSSNGPTEPYAETISRTTRLRNRFANLHQECLRDVGLSKLHRVYDVLDQDVASEQQEHMLKAILGVDQYTQYMGKIWQLKLFEEHMLQV